MKKMIFKTAGIIAAMMTVMSFNSCKKSEITHDDSNPESTELIGELTENRTLVSGTTYRLTGGYHVKQGATLTIQAGVTIVAKDDDIVDYILVEQGAKIDAQGTAENPVVMTSEKQSCGAWGGLHICGKAPINVTGGTSKSEIGDAVYGGNDVSDNSGTLRYIRIEYAGYAFSEEKEGNGFTFYGVGNGTAVEFLQAYSGSDDGFEFFGGTVNVKYLIATNNSDDSFDWTEGWCGKGQFLIAYQEDAAILGYDCDALIEADNNSKDATAQPISHPVLANFTLVGNRSTVEKRGIRLRAGTQVELYNGLVTGKSKSITTQTVETENALVDGTSILNHLYLENTVFSEDGGYSETLFLANENNKINQTFNFVENFKGTVEGGKEMSSVDSFFENATYKGAVASNNDWTKGWTK